MGGLRVNERLRKSDGIPDTGARASLQPNEAFSEWISLSRSSSCRLHRAVFVGRAFGADGHLAHGRLKTPGNPWRGAQDPANGFSRWNGRDGRAPMQHRGRMGGFGICRSLIRSTAIALLLKKTSRPARATTISWTPPRPIVIPECRRVQPASIKPRASVNAGLTGIRTTPLRRRAGRVCQRPSIPCGAQ